RLIPRRIVLFQSPSQRGANYFRRLPRAARFGDEISVPFSKGCQLLRYREIRKYAELINFSPLLKGVPITSSSFFVGQAKRSVFQSPSQRGANYFGTNAA